MKAFRIWITIASLFIGSQVWAAGTIEFTSAEGVSGLETSPIVLFGGTAGNECALKDGANTCNNCNMTDNPSCANGEAPLCACNMQRIYDQLPLRINFKKSMDLPAGHKGGAYISDKGNNTELSMVSSNDGSYIDVLWKDVCAAMGNSSCSDIAAETTLSLNVYYDEDDSGTFNTGESAFAVTVKLIAPGSTDYNVFGSVNMDGIASFKPFAGDRKVYMEELLAGSGSFPSMGYGGTAKHMMVYISDDSLHNATPENGLEPAMLPFSKTGDSLDNKIVDSLENGTLYFFRIAIVDEAGNIVQFMPALTLPNADDEANCNTSPNSKCPYAVSPQNLTAAAYLQYVASASSDHTPGQCLSADLR